jgi:signal transduction histidine kinase
MNIDNFEQIAEALTDEKKILLLRKSIHRVENASFLCRIEPSNPNFLEIIECNSEFLKLFDLKEIEVLGNSYDFLLQSAGEDYGSVSHFDYTKLIKAVKSLQIADVKVNIRYPKNHSKSVDFKVTFVPSSYKTENIYCIFGFEKLNTNNSEFVDVDIEPTILIQNLERALRNERILRSVSDMIASEPDLGNTAVKISKIICQYLKVDRCIVYDPDNSDSGFLIEYCGDGLKKLSEAGDCNDKSSPIARYINFQNKAFLDLNNLKKSNTTIICENVKNDSKFEPIEDLCREFNIGSEIVVIMIFKDEIIGGIYIQQSSSRKWLLEEIQLIEIVASECAMAIDRANYTHKLLISNQGLVKKTAELASSLAQEKKMRELQSEFVALVSHEFKTPLQIIDGARELILRKAKSLNVVDEFIDKSLLRIKSAVSRMNNLIQSNLTLSKIEISENGIEVNKQDFDIKNLINDIVEKNSHVVSEKNINIDINIENLPDTFNGDQKLLDHSFTNMIINAVKYSKAGSAVKISGGIAQDKIFVRVVDQGIGIPAEDLEKIGKKFFRATNTLSVAGTGIGLYLTKYFIELHNGSVLIESELNVGTTITAFLPISNLSS